MSYMSDERVRQLVDQQLFNNPRTLAIYRSDPQFRAAVEVGRGTLQVVADQMESAGVAQWQADEVLRGTLDRMLSDRELARHDEMVRLRSKPLWDKLMDEPPQ